MPNNTWNSFFFPLREANFVCMHVMQKHHDGAPEKFCATFRYPCMCAFQCHSKSDRRHRCCYCHRGHFPIDYTIIDLSVVGCHRIHTSSSWRLLMPSSCWYEGRLSGRRIVGDFAVAIQSSATARFSSLHVTIGGSIGLRCANNLCNSLGGVRVVGKGEAAVCNTGVRVSYR